MVRKRSEERRMQEMVELGRKNAQLYPKVKNWCRHLEIKMESYGLLAEAYRLPIGTMSITCEHASAGGSMSMHLNHVATTFITSNCRGCQFHELVSIDNVGRLILEKEDEVIQKREEAEAEPELPAKLRLRGLVSGDLTEALRREDMTVQSVLELVVLLDDEIHHVDAAKKLVWASDLAPEFFTREAVEVICSHFPDSQHGEICISEICISVIQRLGYRTGRLPEIAFEAAKLCLKQRKNADRACSLIGNYITQYDLTPEPELIDSVVGVQWHGREIGHIAPNRPYPKYFGSNYALKIIGERAIESLFEVLRKRLQHPRKHVRINAAYVLYALIDVFPDIALRLTDTLIDSLDLEDDDGYNPSDSADQAACEILAALYVAHPKETQEKLDAGYRRLSSEAKEILFGTYRRIVMGAGKFADYGQQIAPRFEACLPLIIQPLLQSITGLAYPIEVKVAASEILDLIAKYYPQQLIDHLDTLLGTLANLSQEDILLNERKAGNTMEELEKQGHQAQYGRVIREVRKALEAVCDVEPRLVLERLSEIVPMLDSTQQHAANYKSELASLYGQLGRRYELLPGVIPELFKLFMDFSSVAVRGSAILAVGKILRERSDVLPQNMIEMLILYLNDRYVYIHKSATRAIQHLQPSNAEEAENIAYRLLALDTAYEKDPYFREEVLSSLIHITHGYKDLLTKLAVPLIIKQCRGQDSHLVENALRRFRFLLPQLSERYKSLFAREVLTFWGTSERDRFNDDTYSERNRLLLALFEFPKQIIAENITALNESVRAKAKDDPWDALRLTHLLSYFELHLEAATLAEEVAIVQPQNKRSESIIQEAKIIAGAARAESLIKLGLIDEAIKVLEETSASEAKRHEKIETRDFRDVIDSLTVADKIADELT
jgi:hypothetical protein